MTLDDFSVLSASEKDLKDAGWISEDMLLGATMNVADLECVVEILQSPARIVHYFLERQRFQKTISTHADELDLLGFYLETGFNVSQLETRVDTLTLDGMSGPIDKFYTSRDAGVKIEKPRPKISPYFYRLTDGLERRKPERWLGMVLDIYRSLDLREQIRLERDLDKLKRSVEKNWRDPKHVCMAIVTPPSIRDAALVFYVFPPELHSKRHVTAEKVCADALEISKKRRCILVARDTSKWGEPYSFVGLAIPGDFAAKE